MLKNKKGILIIVTVVVISVLGVLLRPKKLGTIDNQNVTLEELINFGEKNENQVASSFTKKHNITSYGKEFWSKSYENESPLDDLYETALDDLVSHRSMLKLAEEMGVIEETSFADEVKEWEASKNNLSLWQFLDSKDTRLSDDIKDALLESNPPTDAEREEAFMALEDKYKRNDFMSEIIVVEGYDKDLKTLEAIKNMMPNNLSLYEAVDYWQTEIPNYSIVSMSVDSREIHKEDIYMMSISEILIERDVNDIVEGYEEGQYFFVLNKEGGGLLTLEEAPRFGEVSYVNALFEQRFAETKESLDIELTQYAKKGFKDYYIKK